MNLALAELASLLRLTSTDPRSRQLERYIEARGSDAARRQVQLAIDNYQCCWQPRSGAHHPACREGARG